MATVDQRLVDFRATEVMLDGAIALLGGISDASTIADIRLAITAEYTDPQDCVQCGGTGTIEAVLDTEHFPNETEDSVVSEAGVANPTIYCPLCKGDKVTEGAYRVVPPSGVITYEPAT